MATAIQPGKRHSTLVSLQIFQQFEAATADNYEMGQMTAQGTVLLSKIKRWMCYLMVNITSKKYLAS